MSNPFIGEIRMFGGNFAPNGWLFCQGQLVSISDYDTLFNLIGTTYGGDGINNFALPNLQSRIPLHQGTGGGTTYPLGSSGGVESVQLLSQQLPVHTHVLAVDGGTTGTTTSPTGAVLSGWSKSGYSSTTPQTQMSPASLAPAGASQPHENMSPYLAINFIISMYGIYPSPA